MQGQSRNLWQYSWHAACDSFLYSFTFFFIFKFLIYPSKLSTSIFSINIIHNINHNNNNLFKIYHFHIIVFKFLYSRFHFFSSIIKPLHVCERVMSHYLFAPYAFLCIHYLNHVIHNVPLFLFLSIHSLCLLTFSLFLCLTSTF